MSSLAPLRRRPCSTNCCTISSLQRYGKPGADVPFSQKRGNATTLQRPQGYQPNSQIQYKTLIPSCNRSHTWQSNSGWYQQSHYITISHCDQHSCAQIFTNLLKFTFDFSNSTFHLNQGQTTLPSFLLLSSFACSIGPFLDFGFFSHKNQVCFTHPFLKVGFAGR